MNLELTIDIILYFIIFDISVNTNTIGIFTIWLVSNTQCKVDFYPCVLAILCMLQFYYY